ncbi:MAG TPA: MOSC N-terminal beta barrel domain-containing protein [Usitatibacter sp.]|nr:MOSC N-terminal beta barrel domain-containing protein [Usitatibacter sp.]
MGLKISQINVYPVKGLKGIALEEARCTDRGIENDRRWMVVDAEGVFLSQREHPKMATVWTDLEGDFLSLSAPDAGSVEVALQPPPAPSMKVRVWRSTVDAVPASREADWWLSQYLGMPCRLVHMPRDSERYSNEQYAGEGKRVAFADGYAYLLIGEGSLQDLNGRLAAKGHPPLPMNRFRPNLVVSGAAPYAEDGWGDIRIGEAAFRGVKPCGRCQVTTTDQATGEVTGPEPLATLATFRESSEFGLMFGMNLVSVKPGNVKVGDEVHA